MRERDATMRGPTYPSADAPDVNAGAADRPPCGATATEPDAPALRVVRGRATGEEVAAVVTVLMARLAAREQERAAAAAASRGPARARSAWCDRSSLLGSPIAPGPGAWRASALPRH